MTSGNFDLFGDLVDRPIKRLGRPLHQIDAKKANDIRLLAESGKSMSITAKAVGLSPPTIRRHYFQELALGRAARAARLDDFRQYYNHLGVKIMTGDDEDLSEVAIEMCRGILATAGDQFRGKGISSEDVAIAAAYGALDQAKELKGDYILAIEWLRSSLDLFEKQLMGIASVGR